MHMRNAKTLWMTDHERRHKDCKPTKDELKFNKGIRVLFQHERDKKAALDLKTMELIPTNLIKEAQEEFEKREARKESYNLAKANGKLLSKEQKNALKSARKAERAARRRAAKASA